ncbi:Gx transporter family protein [Elusimicrobiota bacterium]
MKIKNRYIPYIAVFTAAASVLQVVEWLIPHPLPWLKLGLANIITLLVLVIAGPVFSVSVTIGRTVLSSFLMGTFLSPAFILSFSGGLVSCLAMIIVFRPLGRLSLKGVSILGALTHNFTQLLVVYILLIRHEGIIFLLPVLFIVAVVTGWLNGALVSNIIPSLARFSVKKIYLASSSQRRIDILKEAGLPVIVISHGIDEDSPGEDEGPEEFCMRQASNKLNAVYSKLSPPGCVISSDTIVEVDGKIFGKPSGEEEAKYMLSELSGKLQKVHTAVIIKTLGTHKEYKKVETTVLKFKEISEDDKNMLKGQFLDMAGGYAIQGMNDKYIEWIKGSYTNVVGFPVEAVRGFLKEIW